VTDYAVVNDERYREYENSPAKCETYRDEWWIGYVNWKTKLLRDQLDAALAEIERLKRG